MRFYLSSYRLGKKVKELKRLIPENRKTAYISNALDAWSEIGKKKRHTERDIAELAELGLDVERLDLRRYFGRQREMAKKLDEFGVVWVSGGNTFVLRQAMKLSGFDAALKKLAEEKREFLYGGYSAGVCVLSPSLRGTDLVDDTNAMPYKRQTRTIWKGLGLVGYAIAPHYRSDHPESKAVENEVAYYIRNKLPFKTLRDGEVIIIR